MNAENQYMHNDNGLKPIWQSFNEKEALPRILKHAHYLSEMDRRLQSVLPLNLRGLFKLANIRLETLVIMCRSQIEGSKVRMHSREILLIFNQNFKNELKKVRIIIDS